MRVLPTFLPGSVSASALTSVICLATAALTLVAKPINLVALFILSTASLFIHLPVLFMLLVHAISRRRQLGIEDEAKKCRGVHICSNQLVLTVAHTAIWLAIVAVFIADIARSLTPPSSLICPSPRCGAYAVAVTLSYVQFFVLVAQILGFALVIYEVQSAPRRVLANRNLSHIIKKPVSQLISIREEVRRVRAMGMADSRPSTPNEGYFTETAGTLARAESAISLPNLHLEEVRNGHRRRARTTSATSTTSMRLQDRITLGDVVPVVVTNQQILTGDVGLELHRLRHAYQQHLERTRYLSTPKAPRKRDSHVDFHHEVDVNDSRVRCSLTAPSDEMITVYDEHATPLSVRICPLSPARAESTIVPLDDDDHRRVSAASRYSRWSGDATYTPKPIRRILTDSTSPSVPVTPRSPSSPETPRHEEVVTPTG